MIIKKNCTLVFNHSVTAIKRNRNKILILLRILKSLDSRKKGKNIMITIAELFV
jgi:hypothetical protein